jgi:hypothetical protein
VLATYYWYTVLMYCIYSKQWTAHPPGSNSSCAVAPVAASAAPTTAVKRNTPGLLLRLLSSGPCRSKLTEKTLPAESPCILAKYCTGSPAAVPVNNLTVPAVTDRAVLNFTVKVIWAADFAMMLLVVVLAQLT